CRCRVRPRAAPARHRRQGVASPDRTGRRLRPNRASRRRRRPAGKRLLMSLLTPVGAFVALAALVPLAALLAARARTGAVRRRLGLSAPGRSGDVRPLLATAAIALLG